MKLDVDATVGRARSSFIVGVVWYAFGVKAVIVAMACYVMSLIVDVVTVTVLEILS